MRTKLKDFLKTEKGIFGLVMFIFSVACIITASKLPMIIGATLRSGFFPIVISILLLLFSVVYFIQEYRGYLPVEKGKEPDEGKKASDEKKKTLIWGIGFPLGLAGLAILANVLGIYIVIAAILFVFFRIFDKFSMKKSVLLTVIYVAVLYMIFSFWLMVPFPTFLNLGLF